MQSSCEEILRCPRCRSTRVYIMIHGVTSEFSLYKCRECGRSIQGQALIRERKEDATDGKRGR